MPRMSVTLDVSKLSGWLNADAPCQESNGGHTVRGELRGGRRKMAGDGGAGEASIFLHTGRLPRYISHPSKIATTGILRQLPGMQLLVR